LHVEDVVSKYWLWLQVARQRPFVRTGSALLQLVHWLNDSPEQVAQSGWQETQFPAELNVLEGQELTHCPSEASKLFTHVKQKLAVPEQLVQDEEQAV
jgi:hypothetical protein